MKSTSSIRTWAHSWAVALGFLIVSDAQAVLISVDDPAYGPGAITRDTVNQLDWLDFEFSLGLPTNEVVSQFGPGGTFAGFRYATGSEIVSLWAEAGFPPHSFGGGLGGSPYLSSVFSLLNLTGSTFALPDLRVVEAWGVYDSGGVLGSSHAGFAAVFRFLDSYALLAQEPIRLNNAHFLVRSVPDSGATIGLLSLVFVGLAATRRFVRC